MLHREEFIEARNMDLKVWASVHWLDRPTEDWDWLKKEYVIGENDGLAPEHLDFAKFTDAAQMTNYEFGAYVTMGDEKLDALGVEYIEDLFGTDFAKAFYKRKTQLLAQYHLAEARKELAEAQARVDRLEAEARGDE